MNESAATAGQKKCDGGTDDLSKMRISDDGLLEILQSQSNLSKEFVVLVPEGEARPGLTWKNYFIETQHIGVYGGHRNADQTVELLQRYCFWKDLRKDVVKWIYKCATCAKFRRAPRKLLQSHFSPKHLLPWHHVLVDFEGPITPADRDGGRYIFTYTCLVCLGSFLEVIPSLTHYYVRKAVLACVFKAKTIPMLFGHDGGVEFCNILIAELEVMLNIEDAKGRRYRPRNLHLLNASTGKYSEP